MDWVAGQSGVAYGASEDATKAHRVLADHGRGMTFITAEGVAPSWRAASEKLPVSTTLAKTAISLSRAML